MVTLIQTTSFPNGFIAKSSGGIEAIKTTFKDKSLKSIVANLTITDLAKSKPLSNIVKVNVPLKEIPTVARSWVADLPFRISPNIFLIVRLVLDYLVEMNDNWQDSHINNIQSEQLIGPRLISDNSTY